MNSAMAMVLLAMAIVIGAIFLILSGKGMDPAQLWEALLKSLLKDKVNTLLHAAGLLVLLGGVVVAYATRDASRKARLTLGPEGIDYRFPAPEWIPGIARKWFIPWGKLKGVRLQTMHFMLILHDGNRRRVLRLMEWIEEGAADSKPGKGFSLLRLPLTVKGRRAFIEDSPVMRALRERGIEVDAAGSGAAEYDLLSSPAVRSVLIALTVMTVYIFVDGFLLEETYPNDPPFSWLGTAGGLMAIGVMLTLYNRKVPHVVTFVVGSLAGLVVAIAGYSGLLRINQLTDTAGMKSYEYELQAHTVRYAAFRPLQDGLPEIELRRHRLWSSQAKGSHHHFELRRGGLGFYQLNMAPIRQALRMYNDGYRTRSPANSDR